MRSAIPNPGDVESTINAEIHARSGSLVSCEQTQHRNRRSRRSKSTFSRHSTRSLSLRFAPALHRRHIGARIRFRQCKCSDGCAVSNARQIFLLLRFVPKSVIAPEPNPCIANAKSAKPEWRASVSRMMHIARVSIFSAGAPYAVPPIAYFSQPASPSSRTSLRQADQCCSHVGWLVAAHTILPGAEPTPCGAAAERASRESYEQATLNLP